jgi:hypothetical protein
MFKVNLLEYEKTSTQLDKNKINEQKHSALAAT